MYYAKNWVVRYEQTTRKGKKIMREVFIGRSYLLADEEQVKKFMKRNFRTAKVLSIIDSPNESNCGPESNVATSNTLENSKQV